MVGWGDDRTNFAGGAVAPNRLVRLAEAAFSKSEYGRVLAIADWQEPYREPLYLSSNLRLPQEAVGY
jgi:hypothetical protein